MSNQEEIKLDAFHAHEVLDRLHVQQCNLEEHLLLHPFVLANEDVKKLLEEIQVKMSAAYQLIGNKNFDQSKET